MRLQLQFFTIILALIVLSGCSGDAPNFRNIPKVPVEFDCGSTNLLPIPEDPRARGPWAVGVKTVNLRAARGGNLVTEIWYPAKANSEIGASKEVYDLRYALPPADARKVPDNSPLVQECDCYRDLPIDNTRGEFPVIIYIHGTAAFRTASLNHASHWASRGFVVINADNPNIQLKDLKANFLAATQARQAQDTVKIMEALHDLPSSMAFLDGNIDLTRIGMSGHSAGGNAAAQFGDAPGVRTIISMAAGGVSDGEYLKSSMVIAANADGVVNYGSSRNGYRDTAGPKRFGGIDNTGHLAFTQLCFIGRDFGGVIPLVKSYGIDVPSFFLSLGTDGCGESFTSSEDGWHAIDYLSTAAFEETLQCSAAATDALSRAGNVDFVVDFEEDL